MLITQNHLYLVFSPEHKALLRMYLKALASLPSWTQMSPVSIVEYELDRTSKS